MRGHVSAKRPVEELVGKRMPLPLGLSTMECWSVYQLEVSAKGPVEALVGKRVPLPVKLRAIWDLKKVACVTN